MDFKNLIRREVMEVEGYPVEVEPHPIKLDANEFPYSAGDDLQQELLEAARSLPFNRYPDPQARELRETAGRALGLPPDMLLIGNGSDELIQLLLIALSGGRPKVLIPHPTFAMYEIASAHLGFKVIRVPLKSDFDLDLAKILRRLNRSSPRAIFISYPNNPTGNCFSRAAMLEIIKLAPGLVVVDEAYFNFCGRSFIPHLEEFSNLAVLRSLSKVGLAGLRVGILIAHPKLIGLLAKVKLPYNVGLFPQRMAMAALENKGIIDRRVKQVIEERERLARALADLPGIHPFPSEANFILFRLEGRADEVHRLLLEKGISIKNLNRVESLKDCLRVTIGRPEENQTFLKALSDIIRDRLGETS